MRYALEALAALGLLMLIALERTVALVSLVKLHFVYGGRRRAMERDTWRRS